MRANSVLVAIGIASFGSLLGCLLPGQDCTKIGCFKGAELKVAYPGSATETLAGGTLRVCRGELCNHETVVAAGAGLALAVPYETHVRLVESSFQNLVLTLKVDGWRVDLKDGDLYSVELRDKNGVVVASKEWQATYQHPQPNGEGCGDDCAFAQLD